MSAHPEQLTLFALPPMCPTWPQRGTLAERALALLLEGRNLDHPTFEAETGSWRLAAVVFELRELGWPVQTTEKLLPTPNCPTRHIATYCLSACSLAHLHSVQNGMGA